MGTDEYVRELILNDPDITTSAITTALNKKHGLGSVSYCNSFSLTQVKHLERRVRHQLSKWQ